MPNLQDAQALATARAPDAGEHLEQSARGGNRVLLMAALVLEQVNRAGCGPVKQVALYRHGGITEDNAVEGPAMADWRRGERY